ncbi:LOW QUALITY PROTEIN: flavin-containing monooxygenase 5-like [Sarcophilus harrisii]
MPVKRVAVIGAGVSDISAIKCCLEEGLEPTCFEGSNDIGGLWRYQEKAEAGRPGIRSLTCNTSKEMTAFSDYPFPDNYPNYLHNSKMMEYLQMYIKHFELLKHIRFLSKVCSVRKRYDFSSTGQWDVVVDADGKQEFYIFDAIMVCSGHYPNLPLKDFPGLNKLPSQKGMMADIKRTRAKLNKQFLQSPRDTSRVPYVEYMDEIASEIGVKPNVFSLFLSDPKLALEVFFGPCTPYQYRLQGPGKWAGARAAILTERERIIKPMRTRVLNCNQPPSSKLSWLLKVCLSLALFFFILVISK